MGTSSVTASSASVAQDEGQKGTSDQQSWTREEESKLVWKIDRHLLPTAWLMFLLAWMDRSNIGSARIAGMADDLNLSSSNYSLSIIVFYIGYLIFGPPSNLLVARLRPSIYLPCLMLAWGVCTCCMSAVKTYPQLLVLRILTGIAEAGFTPGLYFLLSCWYVPQEQGKRGAVIFSAALVGGAFGGIVAGTVTGGLEGAHGIRGWRWLFIIEGVVTIGSAILASFILPDFPSTCHRFTVREKEIANARLRLAGTETQVDSGRPPLGKVESIKLALKDWRTWAMTGMLGLIGPSSVMPYFYPTLVRGLGYADRVTAQYMTVPIWAVAFVCALTTGIVGDRYPAQRALILAGWLTLATVMTISVCAVYGNMARYVLIIFMGAGCWSSVALSIGFSVTVFRGMRPEVRAIAVAIPPCVGNFGNVYGAYLFPTGDAPKYLMGFGVISATLGLAAILLVIIHVRLRDPVGEPACIEDSSELGIKWQKDDTTD